MNKNIAETKDSVDGLIDRARDAVVEAADRAERGVESAADSVAGSAHSAGDSVRDGARTASRRAHRSLNAGAKSLDRGYGRARDELSRAATATTDYATEHPGTALLIAAAAGFVLGLLLRGRRRSD